MPPARFARGCAWQRTPLRAFGLLCGAELGCFSRRLGATCTAARWADAHALPLPAADIISAVEFDATGAQLATGDRGGRVVLFEQVDARADQVRGAKTLCARLLRSQPRRGCAARGRRGIQLLRVSWLYDAGRRSGAPPRACTRVAARRLPRRRRAAVELFLRCWARLRVYALCGVVTRRLLSEAASRAAWLVACAPLARRVAPAWVAQMFWKQS